MKTLLQTLLLSFIFAYPALSQKEVFRSIKLNDAMMEKVERLTADGNLQYGNFDIPANIETIEEVLGTPEIFNDNYVWNSYGLIAYRESTSKLLNLFSVHFLLDSNYAGLKDVHKRSFNIEITGYKTKGNKALIFTKYIYIKPETSSKELTKMGFVPSGINTWVLRFGGRGYNVIFNEAGRISLIEIDFRHSFPNAYNDNFFKKTTKIGTYSISQLKSSGLM
jgi:hypothetical protein